MFFLYKLLGRRCSGRTSPVIPSKKLIISCLLSSDEEQNDRAQTTLLPNMKQNKTVFSVKAEACFHTLQVQGVTPLSKKIFSRRSLGISGPNPVYPSPAPPQCSVTTFLAFPNMGRIDFPPIPTITSVADPTLASAACNWRSALQRR